MTPAKSTSIFRNIPQNMLANAAAMSLFCGVAYIIFKLCSWMEKKLSRSYKYGKYDHAISVTPTIALPCYRMGLMLNPNLINNLNYIGNTFDLTYWETYPFKPKHYETTFAMQNDSFWEILPFEPQWHMKYLQAIARILSFVPESYSGRTTLEVLQEVCANIKLDEFQIKSNNKFLVIFLNFLINALKAEDALFDKIFQNIVWSGSYYDGLKVDAPDEYDLNIVLRFPFKQNALRVTCDHTPPAYAQIDNFGPALREYIALRGHSVYEKMERWCNLKGTLLQNKVREWFEGLLAKVLYKYQNIIPIKGKVVLKKSGPALTLQFLHESLSIDLVPVFGFQTVGPHAMNPPKPFRPLLSTAPWYAVPKPYPGRDDIWRLSFCLQEKALIHHKGLLKPAIKLLKKLRDTEQWYNLASYYIKTIFLWEICFNDTNNYCNWNEDLAQTFIRMLNKLLQCLEDGEIKSLWDPRYNLLSPLKSAEIANMKFRLRKLYKIFLSNFDEDPEMIGQIICPSP